MTNKSKFLKSARRSQQVPTSTIRTVLKTAEKDRLEGIDHATKNAKILAVRPANPFRALRYRLITAPNYPEPVDGPHCDLQAWQQAITQEQMAELTGITQGAISKIEANILSPSCLNLGRLLDHGATVQEILEIIHHYKSAEEKSPGLAQLKA